MRIGIDLRPLQNGHRYRGIGEVAKQVTNRIIRYGAKEKNSFVFYAYDDSNPLELLTIPKDVSYTIVGLGPMPERAANSFTKKQKLMRVYNELISHPIKQSKDVDVFLQYDYAAGVPKNTRTVLVKHDLIPYIFWDKYFESAWVPFKNKALRSTIRTLFANYKFMRLLHRGLRNAHMIITVSNSTKEDLKRYFSIPGGKMKVAQLGVDKKPAKTNNSSNRPDMPSKPYLLFIGAGDARRRVDDAIAAFNNLRSQGYDLQFVLAGENFKSPETIPNRVVRNEVMGSSYARDILTMGYIDDKTKQTLYRDAIAYIYPTKYEGFGIPILEAMLMECPVVVYNNSSTYEVGGDFALYAQDWEGIVRQVKKIIGWDDAERKLRKREAKLHAEQFTWDKTAYTIYTELKEVVRGST